jgi:aminopeptidase
MQGVDSSKRSRMTKARSESRSIYMQRTGTKEMKRTLCLFPTEASAQEAGMNLAEYEQFVFGACLLHEPDPIGAWHKVRESQQAVVDLLNTREKIRYVNADTDISFSTKGRTWINSDGQTNMPSGEVYTSPVENSVNGHIRFNFPGIFMGQDIEDIHLTVKDGQVVSHEAKRGGDLLAELLALPGARRFGEAAIGTNYNINRQTRNMLFDEKMGGTVHMALGQSYFQTGGKNESDIHWDLLANMSDGGAIYADNEKIYENGRFIF